MQFKGVNIKERLRGQWTAIGLEVHVPQSAMFIVSVVYVSGNMLGVLASMVHQFLMFSAFPPPLPLVLFPLIIFISVWRVPVSWRGGSWLGCVVVPAMGVLFYLGAGCAISGGPWTPQAPNVQTAANALKPQQSKLYSFLPWYDGYGIFFKRSGCFHLLNNFLFFFWWNWFIKIKLVWR